MRLWQPVPFESSFDCDFAIDGLPVAVHEYATGIDSFSALTSALSAIRLSLAPYADQISWLGQRGEHGIPFIVNFFENGERRRVEELVESELERYVSPSLERMDRWHASLREQYDPDSADADYGTCTTDDLLEHLRAASARERTYRTEGNPDAAFVFSQKRWPIVHALRERPEYDAILERLTSGDDRALRLLAAQLQFPAAIATLERSRAENVEPEASEAASLLHTIERSSARPKPWDAPHGSETASPPNPGP